MIVIIGGGPAGLAVAYYLQRRGLPYRLLEKETVGWSWQNHYDSLALHTFKQASHLPGLPMPDAYPDFPDKAQVAAYLQDYARHFRLNVQENTAVFHATYRAPRWHLTTSQDQLQAAAIVAATGIWSTPHIPDFDGLAAFNGRIVHSQSYKRPDPFQGQRVLVVGAGNSGAEIAAELGQAGVATAVAIRSGVAFVPYPSSPLAMRLGAWLSRTLPDAIINRVLSRPDYSAIGIPPHPQPPTESFPVVGDDLPQAVQQGKVTPYPGIDRFVADGVHFVDGRFAAFDTIIMATGYRPTLDFIDPTPTLDENGRLRHPDLFPHLYPVGYHYPNTEGWLQAIPRVARRTANTIAAALV